MKRLKKFIPIVIIVALMIIAYFSGVGKYLTYDNLKAHHSTIKDFVAAHPFLTPLIFIGAYIVMAALSLPGAAILSVFGGFLFPHPFSTIYVVIGATIGATLIFLAARTALGELLYKKAGKLLSKMEKGFKENAISYLFFLRFVPIFPFWIVNLAAAFFRVSLWPYLWTTFIGIAPGSFVFTQAGVGLSAIFETGAEFSLATVFNMNIRIALIALGIFALIPIIVKKLKNRKNNHNA